MPTVVTSTVGTSSRDYSTFALAEADIETLNGSSGDLVTEDNQIVFEAYNDSTFTAGFSVDGGGSRVMDATRNVIFRAASGEECDGTPGSGVQIAVSGQALAVLRDSDFAEFEGIEFRSTGLGGFGATVNCNGINGAYEGTVFRKCLFYASATPGVNSSGLLINGNGNDVGSSSNPFRVENCVFLGYSAGNSHGLGLFAPSADNYTDVINCSFGDCHGAERHELGSGQTVTARFINCLSVDVGAAGESSSIYSSAGTLTTTGSTNNFGEDSTNSFPGTGTPHPITGTTSTSPGAGDWAIYTSATNLALVDDTDNDVLDGGVGPSSNSLVPTDSINGETRSGTTTDPGAFQLAAAAGANEGTGSGALGGVAASGSGTVQGQITGTGTGALGSVAATGAGTVQTLIENQDGDGGALGTVAASGAGTVQTLIEGTGSGSLGTVAASGAGTVAAPSSTITGTGSGALGSVAATGAGTVTTEITGSGTGALGSVAATGSGAVAAAPPDITGSGSASLGVVAATGAGTVQTLIQGTGAAALGVVAATGVGRVDATITGTGTAALGTVSATGTSQTADDISLARANLVVTWIIHVSRQDTAQESPFV